MADFFSRVILSGPRIAKRCNVRVRVSSQDMMTTLLLPSSVLLVNYDAIEVGFSWLSLSPRAVPKH